MLSSFAQMQNYEIFSVFYDMLFNYDFANSFPVQACLVSTAPPEMMINMKAGKTALARSGGLENLRDLHAIK